MKRMILIAIALATTAVLIQAQIDTIWVRTYNGSGDGSDYGKGCAAGLDNSVYVTGQAYTTNFDYLTVKYDSIGNVSWFKYLEGPGANYDEANACAIDNDNNVYITGRAMCPPSNHYGRWTLKLSATNGDTLWSSLIDLAGENDGLDCVVDDSSNLITTGKTTVNTHNDYLTIKHDPTGNPIWSKVFVSEYNLDGQGKGCAVNKEGQIYVTGYSSNTTDLDILTIKYNNNGDTLWTRRFSTGTGVNQYGADCAVDDSGYIYVVGYEGFKYIALKYSATGDTVWTKEYICPAGNESDVKSCTVDKYGYLYITGNVDYSQIDPEIYTLKIKCTTGDTVASIRYFGASGLKGQACSVDSTGHLYVVGETSSPNDYLIIKYTRALHAPALMLPIDGASFTSSTPSFLWHQEDSATAYRLQISPFSNFASLTFNQTTAETTLTSTALPDNWYYWRVKAYSATDSSEWSEVRSFSVSTSTLAAPTLLFPPADTITNDSFPDYDWSDVAGATQYQVQAGTGFRWVFAGYYNGSFNPFNNSDPAQLLLGQGVGTGNIEDIAVRDSFAIIAENNGLRTLKITNPAWPVAAGGLFSGFNQPRAVRVRDTLAFVADASLGLVSVNVANPAAPVIIDTADLAVGGLDLELAGDYAYLACANGGLRVVDISDPAAMTAVGSLATTYAYGVAVSGGYAYLADNSTLRVINVANPAAPAQTGVLTGMSGAHDVAVRGTLAYVADGGGGLRIVNVANPASPSQLGAWGTGSGADCRRVVLADSFAYVADMDLGLLVLNVANAAAPQQHLQYSSYYYSAVAVLDSFAPAWFDSAVAASQCAGDTFPGDGLRCWRARAGAGSWGPWSAPRRFTFDTNPPPQTWITSPGNDQLINDTTPLLACYDYGHRHRFQVAADTAFAALEADTAVWAAACTLRTALPDGRHYLRAQSGDSAGNWSAWSSRYTFRLDSQAPASPTAVTANGANPSMWTNYNYFQINLNPPESTGIQYYYYKVGAAPVSDYDTTGNGRTTSVPFQLVIQDDGVTPLYIWAADVAGNLDYRTAARVDLRYDHTAPSGARAQANEYSRTNAFTVSWNAGSDLGGSGLNGHYVINLKVNGGTWTELNPYYAGTSYIHTGSQGNRYFFEVAALDSAGNREALTAAAECSTLVDNTITRPILVSPANGAVRGSAVTAFTWQRATAQAGSRLQCSYDTAFTSLARDTALAADSMVTLTLADSLFYWRAQGRNSPTDTSAWTPAYILRIDTQAPAAPALALPANDSLVNDNTPQFSWVAAAGAVRYRLAVAADSGFAAPLIDREVDTAAYTAETALPDSVYWWRAMSGDAAGNWSAWSARRSFTVDTRAPAVPAALAPAEGATVTTNLPQFRWNASAGATRYQLQVSTDQSFPSTELDSSLADTSLVPQWGLNDGTHYWRVRCRDAAGNWSAWNGYRTLQVSGILQVALATPAAGSVWPPSTALWLQFSKPLNTGYIDTTRVKVRGRHTPIVRSYLTWQAASRTLMVAPDSSFAANDTITVTLSGGIRDSNGVSSLDGNGNGIAAGDSTDNYQTTFYTSLVGDYNRDRAVGAVDLLLFTLAWNAYDRYYEAGPYGGAWPHQRVWIGNPSGSTRLDFEDAMGLIFSWDRAAKAAPPAKGGAAGPVALELSADGAVLSVSCDPALGLRAMDATLRRGDGLSLGDPRPSPLWRHEGLPGLFLAKRQGGDLLIAAASWPGAVGDGSLFAVPLAGGAGTVTLDYRLYDGAGAEIAGGSASCEASGAPGLPLAFALGRAAPNPALRRARISYQLPQACRVALEVYNIAGQRVAVLADGQQPAGYHARDWDLTDGRGNRVGAGVYFYKLAAGADHAIGKLTVVR